jgi:hypothetical protein
MSLKLAALIKKTEAAIAVETDPKKLRQLAASLAMYSSTRADMGDDDGDDGDKKKDGDDGDDESKAKKAAAAAAKAKGKAEAAKHRAKAAEHKQKAAESEELAKKAEEESSSEGDDDKASLAAAPPVALTPGAAAAIASQGDLASDALARIAKLEKSAEARELSALINDARAARRITPGEAKTLAKKDASFVRDFLEMRPKALVHTDEDELATPDTRPNADLPPAVMKEIDRALATCNLDAAGQTKLREDLMNEHRKARANGAVRY